MCKGNLNPKPNQSTRLLACVEFPDIAEECCPLPEVLDLPTTPSILSILPVRLTKGKLGGQGWWGGC